MRLGNRLRTRIVWTTALISAFAMLAMIGAILLALDEVTDRTVESTLKDRFNLLSAGIAADAGSPSETLNTPSDAIDDTTWLFDSEGRQIDGPNARQSIQDRAEKLSSVDTRTGDVLGERTFLAGPVTIGGRPPSTGVLVVSQSRAPYEATRTEVLVGLALLGLLVTAGTTGIAAWTVGRTLGPVADMAAMAEDWSAHELDARFDESPGGDEIAHLGRTLNVLLDRVAGALRSEQRLTSELAHELRTPLTAVRGEAELALMSPSGERPDDRLHAIVDLSDRMTATIRTLLDLARSDHPGSARSTTLTEVIGATLSGRTPDPRIAAPDPPAGVELSATTDLAVRALSPLMDNAERHARSRIELVCSVTARHADINVCDDGSGVAPGDTTSLFDAGVRDEHSTGAGLGLALARRVARTLGGDVTLTSAEHPTTFTLRLPRR